MKKDTHTCRPAERNARVETLNGEMSSERTVANVLDSAASASLWTFKSVGQDTQAVVTRPKDITARTPGSLYLAVGTVDGLFGPWVGARNKDMGQK